MPVAKTSVLSNINPAASWVPVLRNRVSVRLPGFRNDGEFAMIEIEAIPGAGFPRHMHQREDEIFIVLQGTATFDLGRDSFDAGPGSVTVLPRLVPHAWWNYSCDPLRMSVIIRPAGLETLFTDHRMPGIGLDDLKTLLRVDHGIIMLSV
ncbi:MAG: cupin domain-containing protein [Candidatus Omnitrophica bacterium]|nr:cupin domain-containing protein [Candidatus Omnitrophota bacterium]MCB9720269.1 cupin domain-containing protein [Candidatus Omnitrophota bacterium]